MLYEKLVDFYRGWMIEVIHSEVGFQSTCFSPTGQHLTQHLIQEHEITAWRVAATAIDEFLICYTLKLTLREFYESGSLAFGEWRSLSQSLEKSLVS